MRARRRSATIALFAILGLGIAGCAPDTDTDQAASDTPREAPEETPDANGEDGGEEEPEPGEAEGEYVHVYSEPVTWQDGGFSLEITHVSIRSRERVVDMGAAEVLDDSSSATFTLDVSARNDSGKVAAWHPDQGQLVLGDEQVDSMLFVSDQVSENAWQPGTEQVGAITWQLRTPFEEVVREGSARYMVDAAGPEDFGGDRLSEPADVTVEWPPDEDP